MGIIIVKYYDERTYEGRLITTVLSSRKWRVGNQLQKSKRLQNLKEISCFSTK